MNPPMFLFVASLVCLFPELGQVLLVLWGAVVLHRFAA